MQKTECLFPLSFHQIRQDNEAAEICRSFHRAWSIAEGLEDLSKGAIRRCSRILNATHGELIGVLLQHAKAQHPICQQVPERNSNFQDLWR